MIPEVKLFLEKVFQAEFEVSKEDENPDLAYRNQLVEKLNEFCHEIMKNGMGFGIRNRVKSTQEEYEKSKTFEVLPRYLFKISQYKNEKLGNVFLAYVSIHDPCKEEYSIFNCLFIAKMKEEYKIIGNYFVGREYEYMWKEYRALDGISFQTAGEFVSAERYLEPKDEEWSMEEYLADK